MMSPRPGDLDAQISQSLHVRDRTTASEPCIEIVREFAEKQGESVSIAFEKPAQLKRGDTVEVVGKMGVGEVDGSE